MNYVVEWTGHTISMHDLEGNLEDIQSAITGAFERAKNPKFGEDATYYADWTPQDSRAHDVLCIYVKRMETAIEAQNRRQLAKKTAEMCARRERKLYALLHTRYGNDKEAC